MNLLREIFGLVLVFILVFSVATWKDILNQDQTYVTQIAVATPTENTETLTSLEKQLWLHEGFRSVVYLDPAGTNFVVGVGRNIQDKGITRGEALYLLRNDIVECTEDLYNIFDNFGDLRSAGLSNCMGPEWCDLCF